MHSNISLAQFISQTREKRGLSQEELAELSCLTIEQIRLIEQGIDLFLPSTIRQKLAKGLKIENKEIKKYEKTVEYAAPKEYQKDAIREAILLNANNPDFEINCPVCGEKLITRIAKLYDLENNLVLRPKARCSKCPFQLTD